MARFGLSKTTVDDIAREAGISRATVYRVFPGGRDEIVGATVAVEVERFFAELARRVEVAEGVEERLVVVMTSAAGQLARHEALALLLAREPELVLPRVSFGELDFVLAVTGSFLAPYLAEWLQPEDARRVGEWVTRLVLSHVVCPAGSVDGLSLPGPSGRSFRGGAGTPFAIHPEPLGEDRARRLVRQFVLPGIEVLMSARPAAPPAIDPPT
jgi:AcrR family transcriptional regulator